MPEFWLYCQYSKFVVWFSYEKKIRSSVSQHRFSCLEIALFRTFLFHDSPPALTSTGDLTCLDTWSPLTGVTQLR